MPSANAAAAEVPIEVTEINIHQLVTAFVNIFWGHPDASEVRLTEVDMETLFQVLHTAGYKPHLLSPQHKTNHPPFNVLDEEGSEDKLATGWLASAIGCAAKSAAAQRTRGDIVSLIKEEITGNVPLVPIQLTEHDCLIENPPTLAKNDLHHFVLHTRDGDELKMAIGLHQQCGQQVHWSRTSGLYYCLTCRCKKFNVKTPTSVSTYRMLRTYLLENPGGAK